MVAILLKLEHAFGTLTFIFCFCFALELFLVRRRGVYFCISMNNNVFAPSSIDRKKI